MAKTVSRTFRGKITPTGGLRIGLRGYFSTVFLHAAKSQHSLAEALENAHSGRSKYDEDHRAFVVSSVISSFAFLEAMANELLQDAADGHGIDGDGYLSPLNETVVNRLAEYWDWTRGRDTLLLKYDRLLEIADVKRIRGSSLQKSVDDLRHLRNNLVHFKPKTGYADTPADLERRLRGRFVDNKLMAGSANSWYPDHCLGSGCARWAYEVAEEYAREVCDRLGVRPNFARLTRLSVDEVAARLDRSKSTLQRWRSKGTGPQHEKYKGQVAYREQAIHKYEAERGD